MKKHWKKKANKQTGETFQLIDTAFPPKSTRDEHTHTNTHTHSGHFLLFLVCRVPCSFIYHFRLPELRWLRRSVDWSPDWVPEERDQVVFALRFRPQNLCFFQFLLYFFLCFNPSNFNWFHDDSLHFQSEKYSNRFKFPAFFQVERWLAGYFLLNHLHSTYF